MTLSCRNAANAMGTQPPFQMTSRQLPLTVEGFTHVATNPGVAARVTEPDIKTNAIAASAKSATNVRRTFGPAKERQRSTRTPQDHPTSLLTRLTAPRGIVNA